MPAIRPATMSDAPALAHLLRQIGWWERINNEAPPATTSRLERLLAQCLSSDSHTVLVVETPALEKDPQAKLGGYANVHWLPYLFLPGPEGYISELFVHPEARGQGTGEALLQIVLAEAERRGCHRLSLLNGKQRDSYIRKFYEKHGWEERPGMANFVYWVKR